MAKVNKKFARMYYKKRTNFYFLRIFPFILGKISVKIIRLIKNICAK